MAAFHVIVHISLASTSKSFNGITDEKNVKIIKKEECNNGYFTIHFPPF
jgi:hypothetical protein